MMDDADIGRNEPQDEGKNRLLAKQFGLSVIDSPKLTVAPDVLRCVSAEVARRHKILPVSKTEVCVTVAIGDPLDFDTLDCMRYLLKQNVEGAYCNPKVLMEAIKRYYGEKT